MLLKEGKAAVFKRFPFTILLKTVIEQPEVQPLRMKIDPGSKITGLALVNDATGGVVFAAELSHRGQAIRKALDQRRAVRRSRCQRKTRYRKPRWQNRKRQEGWLPPSLESLLANILTWVKRLLDASAANTTRRALNARLTALSLPVECGSGGLTSFNRAGRALPKAHWIDAAITHHDWHCSFADYGNRQKCNVNEIGFPCSKPKGAKAVQPSLLLSASSL